MFVHDYPLILKVKQFIDLHLSENESIKSIFLFFNLLISHSCRSSHSPPKEVAERRYNDYRVNSVYIPETEQTLRVEGFLTLAALRR